MDGGLSFARAARVRAARCGGRRAEGGDGVGVRRVRARGGAAQNAVASLPPFGGCRRAPLLPLSAAPYLGLTAARGWVMKSAAVACPSFSMGFPHPFAARRPPGGEALFLRFPAPFRGYPPLLGRMMASS